ncbi:MAG: AAA family ATPase [Eggerthellaceae bacterium]|nr:AAA family ATPase [Eggerthellaceae bacterium]
MNIQEAAEQMQGAIRAYLAVDANGMLRIPFQMQRPLFLVGPPGVGKTAVAAQVARDMGLNFVSYSITHHTRQSALGLPFIVQQDFDGRSYSVSEYTMSEIIAAVHRARQASGVAEGVLFLDEVNCVSETLAPAMLQFLQYKSFGMHRLPEGWVIVCAGNPPEYNRAAREFDPAMLDRLMKIDVEPDLPAWQVYAAAHGVHPAVTTYLDAKSSAFYRVRAAARGSNIVTPRGWEDLSRMIQAYEAEGMEVSPSLHGRYLQDPEVAEDFGVYYELFRKYEDDYKVDEVLRGGADGTAVQRAARAPFDERVALVNLLVGAMLDRAHGAIELEEGIKLVREDLLGMKDALGTEVDPVSVVTHTIDGVQTGGGVGPRPEGQVGDRDVIEVHRLRILDEVREAVARGAAQGTDAFESAKAAFNMVCRRQEGMAQDASLNLDNSFAFLDAAFGDDSQEVLIYLTKLSADPVLIRLVTGHGSAQYMRHNKSLLFTERGLGLLGEIKALGTA